MSPNNPEHKNKKEDNPESAGTVFEGGPAGSRDSDPAGVGESKRNGADAAPIEEVQKLLAEKQDLLSTLVRRQADFENYRKRVEKERQAERHRAVESLVEHLLPVLDAFDRALAGDHNPADEEYRKGFELIRRQMWDMLSKQGLKRIDSVGKEFDPHLHHAIERVETVEHADGIIIGELQPGYMFHDRVLRPAMVRVAAEPVSKTAREN
ncbi:MAG TPA: nucleotide exchange factor GrpE [Candidatus Acidoferrum sp.]|nr:nucleotide exchange factor GrpE [Candidatus Acidoferrum sp.]